MIHAQMVLIVNLEKNVPFAKNIDIIKFLSYFILSAQTEKNPANRTLFQKTGL